MRCTQWPTGCGRPLRGRPGGRDGDGGAQRDILPAGWTDASAAQRAARGFVNLDDFLPEPDRYWGDLVWVAGLLLVPLDLLALVLTMIWQRPDRERRAAAGVPVGLYFTPWVQGQAPDQPEAGPDEEPKQPPIQGRGGIR